MSRRPSVRAPEIYPLKIGEVRNAAVDFSGLLDTLEVLTGTPVLSVTVEGVANTDLAFASIVVNTATLTINGQSVAAGNAVQFKVTTTDGVAGTRYIISISCATGASPPQTIKREVTIDIVQ